MTHTILVIDPDPLISKMLEHTLRDEGYAVDTTNNGRTALDKLANSHYDLLLMDIALPDVDGLKVLQQALLQQKARQALILTAAGSIATAVHAMRAGAADFLTKPIDWPVLKTSIHKILGDALSDDQVAMWRAKYAPDLIGQDPSILKVLAMVQKIANTECDVLIMGASGTGKELIARSIHVASKRAKNPFLAINCAAIPKDLIESELFGHGRGAFTGANERRIGKFEAADGGTLFLDETGEMDLALQGKFLRVIQEREVTPVGEFRSIKIDVRLVSATNQDLSLMCREKRFREDLYYRLNVIPIELPSLRERPTDIALLTNYFIEWANRRHGRRVRGFKPDVLQAFAQYHWPGNVRELRNLLERLVVLKTTDEPVAYDDLPIHMRQQLSGHSHNDVRLPNQGLDINQALMTVETRLTLDALKMAHGNKARAAELLGLKRTTLVERLKKLKIAIRA